MPDLEFSRIEVSTGIALHVARGSARGGVPVVFLPAYADSWWSWSLVMPELAGHLDVIAVDLRGHGDSDRPSCCYRVDDVAMDVVALLDALEISSAVLVGHSGSCFAARRIALSHPSRVAGLVLVASPLALDAVWLGAFVEEVGRLEDPVPEAFVRDFQLGATHVAPPDDFMTKIVAESQKLPAHVWRAALDGLLEYRDEAELGTIGAPTTLVWGDRDPIVNRDHQERLRDAIPEAKLVVVPATGHSPHWERPEKVAEVLRETADR